ELTIRARLEPIILVDGHGEGRRVDTGAMRHRRGARQGLDKADGRLLGASRQPDRANDGEEGGPNASHYHGLSVLEEVRSSACRAIFAATCPALRSGMACGSPETPWRQPRMRRRCGRWSAIWGCPEIRSL